MNATMTDFASLAEQIHEQDFDHVFQIVDGKVVDAPDLGRITWAPSVYHEDGCQYPWIDGSDWDLLTGYSLQDRYTGPVMHVSEGVGTAIEEALYDLAESAPHVFALVVVEVLEDPNSDDESPEPAGWAIAYRRTL
jgi:hypothetical protein